MEKCVTMMAGFPNEDLTARYVFFRLSQELTKGLTPELSRVMAAYMADNETARLPAGEPIIDVIEAISDPVLRQAAPAQTVAFMAHIAYFNSLCQPFVNGQVLSLESFDSSLSDADLYVREDALYLRQILAEALARLGAGDSEALQAYSVSLVAERDDIEYTEFDSEIDELEALYMGDLDERLATSNDMINSEADTGLSDAIELSRDLERQAKERAERERIFSLIRILGGGL